MINRIGHIEVEARARTVVGWLLNGDSVSMIIQKCEAEYNIKRRTAYKYLKDARTSIAEMPDETLTEKKAVHIERRLKLYRELENKATAQGARTALRILDSIAKIDGSLVEKVDVTTGGEKIEGTVVVLPENGREST